MIQRIQSIYLFLISVLCPILLYSDMSLITVKGLFPDGGAGTVTVSYRETLTITNDAITISIMNNYMMLMLSIIFILAFVPIFLFKNRKRQLMFCSINAGMILIAITLLYLYYQSAREAFATVTEYNFHIPALFLFFMLIFNFLAMRGIKKDEELVRSADRLR